MQGSCTVYIVDIIYMFKGVHCTVFLLVVMYRFKGPVQCT